MAVILGLFGYRRRRQARSNLAYIHQPAQGNANAYGNPYGYNGGGPPPFGPQYPPQVHGPPGPYVYDPATGFAPVRDRDRSLFLSPLLLTPSTRSPPHRHLSTTRHHLARPQSRHQSEIIPAPLIYATVEIPRRALGVWHPCPVAVILLATSCCCIPCRSCTPCLATF